MADRIPSDHPSIETVRARIERHGGSCRLAIPRAIIPDETSVVRVVLDGRIRFARLGEGTADDRWLIGVYDTTRAATEPDNGSDRLEPWLEKIDRAIGASIEIDVIEPGYRYGIREPGTRAVYDAVERTTGSLDAIARNLDDK